MKEIKTFIIADLLILVLKIVGGWFLHSYTMLASSLLDVMLILGMLFLAKRKEDSKKIRGIFTALFGALVIFVSLALGFFVFTTKIRKTSLLIILPVIVCIIARFVVSSFYTNANYAKKKGLLSVGGIISNIDLYIFIAIIVAMILMKVSKWVSILKYADRVGTVLVSLLVIYKAYNLIRHSFAYLRETPREVPESYYNEINARKEVKEIEKIAVFNYGGLIGINCYIQLNDGVGTIDANSFVITLQDYLLKIADIVRVVLVEKKEEKKPKKAKVRSKKQDARNSRSGNGKKGSKGKGSKQKNKKS